MHLSHCGVQGVSSLLTSHSLEVLQVQLGVLESLCMEDFQSVQAVFEAEDFEVVV